MAAGRGAGRNGRHGSSSWLGCAGWLGVQHRRTPAILTPQTMVCIWPHRFSNAADTTRLRRAAGRRAAPAAQKDARCGAARAAAVQWETIRHSQNQTAHSGKRLRRQASGPRRQRQRRRCKGGCSGKGRCMIGAAAGVQRIGQSVYTHRLRRRQPGGAFASTARSLCCPLTGHGCGGAGAVATA